MLIKENRGQHWKSKQNSTLKDVWIFAPQDFSPFWRKITQILRDIPHGHQQWWSSTPSPPNSLCQAVQLPLQQKNPQANLHTVAASLLTEVHPPPPSGLLGHLFPPQRTEYSLFRLWICPDQYWLFRSRTRITKKKFLKKKIEVNNNVV